MRPVTLDLDGFGSFRSATTVDFTDADYFALVGPTGAGKSTIVDAIVFALYGSVPRWDDRRAVGWALAPTVNRGVVRLTFEVGGVSYVAARELRRSAAGRVTVKSARLERASEVLAADGEVTGAVEKLLGLTYDHFVRCVILPQGDFARFLHSTAKERQDTLVDLLGIRVYREIASRARVEESAARQRADLASGQLAAYADATAAAEDLAAARVTALRELAGAVAREVPALVAATGALREADGEVRRLSTERDLLAALRVPADVDTLVTAARAASAAVAAAEDDLAAAEKADTAARESLAAAPPRAALERAAEQWDELTALSAELPALVEARAAAEAAVASVEADGLAAREALASARAARDAAHRAESALALRAHLVAGEPCPVCAQPVDAAPAVSDTPNLAAADRRVAEAEALSEWLRRAWQAASSAARGAATEVDSRTARTTRLRTTLTASPILTHLPPPTPPDLPDPAHPANPAHPAGPAHPAHPAGPAGPADAADAAEAAEAAEAATGPVGRGGSAPAGGPADPAVVAGDAPTRPARRGAAARRAVADQDSLFGDALPDDGPESAAEERGAAWRGWTPDDVRLGPALVRALAELDEVEREAREADGAVSRARRARDAALRAERGAQARIGEARAEFDGARDGLVALGAPAPARQDLGADWLALAEWALGAAEERHAAATAASGAAATAREELRAAEEELRARLGEHDVRPATGRALAEAAEPAVAAAAEAATAAVTRIAERRAEAAALERTARDATEAADVAKLLGQVLRADGFERWLLASALDVLVADAGRTLMELTAGQFELVHDGKDFAVVDHADADSRRPVRTLSGGETFQASLALALALSAQLTGLAAATARLDTIILDEGFGTLDEATLDVVATTLESLTAGGDRMVGVVTHVGALAERVPVRYAVRRGPAGSTVAREDA